MLIQNKFAWKDNTLSGGWWWLILFSLQQSNIYLLSSIFTRIWNMPTNFTFSTWLSEKIWFYIKRRIYSLLLLSEHSFVLVKRVWGIKFLSKMRVHLQLTRSCYIPLTTHAASLLPPNFIWAGSKIVCIILCYRETAIILFLLLRKF